MKKRYYHFVGNTLRGGRPIPADGEWLEESGRISMCHKGLHASMHIADALRYAPGTLLCLVELAGKILKSEDKVCAQKRKIIARFDASDLLHAYARDSALSVADLWDMPTVVRQYLETGDELIRIAAQNAAADAALAYAARAARAAAARAAAYAARAAVYAAEADAADDARAAAMRKKSRARLQTAVNKKFKELLS